MKIEESSGKVPRNAEESWDQLIPKPDPDRISQNVSRKYFLVKILLYQFSLNKYRNILGAIPSDL